MCVFVCVCVHDSSVKTDLPTLSACPGELVSISVAQWSLKTPTSHLPFIYTALCRQNLQTNTIVYLKFKLFLQEVIVKVKSTPCLPLQGSKKWRKWWRKHHQVVQRSWLRPQPSPPHRRPVNMGEQIGLFVWFQGHWETHTVKFWEKY